MGDNINWILKVNVNWDNGISGSSFQASKQCGLFSEIPGKVHCFNLGVIDSQRRNYFFCRIGAAIVYENDLNVYMLKKLELTDRLIEKRNCFFLVEYGNYK